MASLRTGTRILALQDQMLAKATRGSNEGARHSRSVQFCPSSATSSSNQVVITFVFKLEDAPPANRDKWSPTDVTFRPSSTATITTKAANIMEQ
jgi:hypothetical protein